jgi:hypothetical protein
MVSNAPRAAEPGASFSMDSFKRFSTSGGKELDVRRMSSRISLVRSRMGTSVIDVYITPEKGNLPLKKDLCIGTIKIPHSFLQRHFQRRMYGYFEDHPIAAGFYVRVGRMGFIIAQDYF